MSEKIIDNSIVGKRSIHKFSPNWTGSADFGRIVPFHWQELLGTDKVVSHRPIIEMSMLPLAAPTFGKMDLYVHYFFVPTRLLVDNYRDFMNNDGIYKNIQMPYWSMRDFRRAYILNSDAGVQRSLFKHWTSFGLPPFFNSTDPIALFDDIEPISLLPLRAYNQIWWDYYRDPEVFRDENKQSVIITSAGRQSTDAVSMKYIPRFRNIKDIWLADLFAQSGSIAGGTQFAMWNDPNPPSISGEVVSSADMSKKLRQIETLTRLAERLSMSGKRSIDLLFTRYGITPQWDKLNMCQYVGGGKSTVLVKDITSTADTSDVYRDSQTGRPLGAKAGQGYCALSDVNIEFTATEPGYLMGVFSVMPHVHFVQGIGKEWRRRYREDFFTKALEHVGQVAVAKSEVGVNYTSNPSNTGVRAYDRSKDKETFAFTDPYYEYKRGLDILAGDFMTYHNYNYDQEGGQAGEPAITAQYMQSMDMYVDYPLDRGFNAENLQINPADFNKIFFYQGGSNWTNTDDHFHLCIDKPTVMNRPMDGYAVPTLETTEDPHAKKTEVRQSTML